ncbi:hypothetical protein EG68_10595 [Paragonimus skrjabini miyazakii]|uniref:Uncharacterized protein n=1 Tax=Paragonimus skrjabini miyazakii TaxID=59628 RepID=A0A8S9YFV6_9TREM|nr:hypothetical protein EG68_10595 [Paragonimus skrjabini miyazakii]
MNYRKHVLLEEEKAEILTRHNVLRTSLADCSLSGPLTARSMPNLVSI